MNLLVENNHVVGFEPYDFPVNEGRFCPKGVTAYLQVHHPDRLLHPLIKRIPRYFVFVAMLAWLIVFAGFVHSLLRPKRQRT